jgi:hypothetical protein
MDSVGTNEWIFRSEDSIHSFSNGLLSVIQVTETSDKLVFVKYITVHFHGSHFFELFEVADDLLTGNLNLRRDSVVTEETSNVMIGDFLLR